jgi:transketolase
LVPGSADLTGNTGMAMADAVAQSAEEPGGSLIHYGIREHAMGAVMTGMAAHGGIVPVGGTFFVFSDYMRGAVRVAAVSNVHVIYSWTHDSIGLGQDGPTHQPVEQLAAVRAMPGLRVIRPADANETAQAWRIAVDSEGPTALILSRQDLPVLAETVARAAHGVPRGAYVLRDALGGSPDLVLIGTGSEVQLCLAAADRLLPRDVSARVVSMPSWELFAAQPLSYRQEVLPDGVACLAVEAASSFGWERYADDTVSIDHYGASAPGGQLLAEFGFTPDNVAERATALLAKRSSP